jgi:DinB superfamily
MSGAELAALFKRDLTRLAQELRAIPSDGALWMKPPGISNSIGNLVLHLEGNLREYVGRQLGAVPYARQRDLEFSQTGLPLENLRARVEPLATLIPEIITSLSDADLKRLYPEEPFNSPISTGQYLVSLNCHLNYHLGQIDYLRRILTQGGAVDFVQL